MQGNPEIENNAELRHPNHVIEPDQVSQVRGQKTPAMGHNSPAFQAEINEKIHNKNKLDFESEDNVELNSYKFPKPRFYIPNLYKSERPMDTVELLSDIAWCVGPKERPLTYQDFLEDTLRKSVKPKKAKAAVLNSIETDPVFLKGINISIDKRKMVALMDTGSTHNLLAYDVFITLQNKSFTPVNMDMKVAGSTLSDNIVGKAQLNTEFETTTGTVVLSLTYLVAHKLNGYHSIIGAQMLTNPRIIKASTPFHVHLNGNYGNAVIPLHSITKPPSFNSNQVNDAEDNPADTIDEEIIQEHVVIDSTKLNETFSHKDCEINPSQDKNTRDKLCKVIEDNKATFAIPSWM